MNTCFWWASREWGRRPRVIGERLWVRRRVRAEVVIGVVLAGFGVGDVVDGENVMEGDVGSAWLW